jgi:hypothetical protein
MKKKKKLKKKKRKKERKKTKKKKKKKKKIFLPTLPAGNFGNYPFQYRGEYQQRRCSVHSEKCSPFFGYSFRKVMRRKDHGFV